MSLKEETLIDLNPEHLKTVQAILAEHVPGYEVLAFGSRVTWTAKEYSDLDLAVMTDKPLPVRTMAQLKEAFSESRLPFKVDVVDWASISDGFREVVKRDCEVVQKKRSGLSLNEPQRHLGTSFHFIDTPYGLMSSKLKKTKLGEICIKNGGVQTGPFGSQLHQKDYVIFGTPIITVEHLGDNRVIHLNLPRVSDKDKERLSKYSLQVGDIVFSRVGSVDRRALVRTEENGWLFSGRCLRVRPKRDVVDPIFLSCFFGLSGFKEYIQRIAVGATMPSLNTQILSNVPIYFPPPPEQKAIAHILGTLDDKIELNRKMNETLEAMARAIFKSWFVDFDPVRAKMEGRKPDGMDEETAKLFPDGFEDSEMGKIPKGWKIKKLSDLCSTQYGYTASAVNEPIGPKFLRVTDINKRNWIEWSDVPHCAVEAKTKASYTLRVGDLVVARMTDTLPS